MLPLIWEDPMNIKLSNFQMFINASIILKNIAEFGRLVFHMISGQDY